MDETIFQQARAAAALLPGLMRRLFTFDGDPADDLPLAQLRVCSMLYQRPRSMSAMGRELSVSLSAMTQIADRLERAGLVERVSGDSDRRIRHLQLTPRGQEVMQLREEAHVKQVLAALERLCPQARNEVLAGLKTLMRACSGEEDQPCDSTAPSKTKGRPHFTVKAMV
jgi:DNA-binding MarR family transcriptional regulator